MQHVRTKRKRTFFQVCEIANTDGSYLEIAFLHFSKNWQGLIFWSFCTNLHFVNFALGKLLSFIKLIYRISKIFFQPQVCVKRKTTALSLLTELATVQNGRSAKIFFPCSSLLIFLLCAAFTFHFLPDIRFKSRDKEQEQLLSKWFGSVFSCTVIFIDLCHSSFFLRAGMFLRRLVY